MSNLKLMMAASSLVAMFGLVACGGGSSSNTNTTASTTSGPITSFGSIYVNGVEYETSGVDIYIEDEPASESDLRVGMMVKVEGSAMTKVAGGLVMIN